MPGLDKRVAPTANELTLQVEPNALSWPGSETAGEAAAEAAKPDLAQRRAELQVELDREAREFGLVDVSPTDRYGPNGDAVEAVFVALDDIDEFDAVARVAVAQLVAAWRAVDPEARKRARSVVKDYRSSGRYADSLAAADTEMRSRRLTRVAGRATPENAAGLVSLVKTAAQDAADALILRNELDDSAWTVLQGPWAQAMESIRELATAGDRGIDAAAAESKRKLPADEGLGPNAELVRAFIRMLDDLSESDLKFVTAAFKRQPQDELERAHNAVQVLVAQDWAWRDRVRAAQEWVTGMLRPMDPARRVSDRLPMERAKALPPAIDAVTALTMVGVLHPVDVITLCAPWAEAIGEGRLPDWAQALAD